MPEYWWQDWRGDACVIVASGPSAVEQPIDLSKGSARCIAVNDSWKLAPFADVLYACDFAWWNVNNGAPAFEGLRASIDSRACQNEDWGIHKVECGKADDRAQLDPVGIVGWGGNSGFHAMQLAAQFGCDRIALVGFDMGLTKGAHWHGRHANGLSNPTHGNTSRWRRAVDAAARLFAERDIEVVNCSLVSMLLNYPKAGLEETLVRWGCLES